MAPIMKHYPPKKWTRNQNIAWVVVPSVLYGLVILVGWLAGGL
jgi:hypothetical protein